MAGLPRGLYETLITEAFEAHLRSTEERTEVQRTELREAEAADRISLHLAKVIERAVESFGPKERVEKGIQLARKLVAEIDTVTGEAAPDSPIEPSAVLRAVVSRLPDGSAETLTEPLIPLLDTALLTNAPGEPRVGHQLATEIHSADRIDVVMAFIRSSGIAPLLPALRAHCAAR
jgi:hypothetical protein